MTKIKFLPFLLLYTFTSLAQGTLEPVVSTICDCREKNQTLLNEDTCFEEVSDEILTPLLDSLRQAHINNPDYLDEFALGLLAGEILTIQLISTCETFYKQYLLTREFNQFGVPQQFQVINSLDDLNSNIESDQRLMESYCERAIIHFESGYFELAINDLEAARKVDSTDLYPYCLEGKMHMMLGNYTAAYNKYSRAYELAQLNRAPMSMRNPIGIVTAILQKKIAKKD